MRECEKNGGFGDKRKCWEYIILMLLVLLSTLSNGTAEKIKEIDVHVCQGQDAYFNHTSQYPILYAHFGEKKEGEMGPDPLVIRVDEYNKPHEDIKVNPTTYSARLTCGGRIHNGSLVFILHNTQVNDSRTFLVYLREVGKKAMYTVEFKLQVKDNCTNTATDAEHHQGTPQGNVKPPGNIPTSINELPSTGPNVPVTPDTSDKESQWKIYLIIAVIMFLVVVVVLVAVIIKKRQGKPLETVDQPLTADHALDVETLDSPSDLNCDTNNDGDQEVKMNQRVCTKELAPFTGLNEEMAMRQLSSGTLDSPLDLDRDTT